MLAIKFNRQTLHVRRAYMPTDKAPEAYRHSVAMFRAEHDETFYRLDLIKGTRGKAETETVGDHVLIGNDRYYFHMSVCKSVHVLRDEDAAEIERLDREIAQLMEQRQAVLDESFKRGRALHQRDIDPNWDHGE